MDHEKIIKKEDGSRIKISVHFYVSGYSSDAGANYNISVHTCSPRKRKFSDPIDSDTFLLRSMTLEEKKEFIENEYLKIVSKEQIQEAKLELWQKLKPKF